MKKAEICRLRKNVPEFNNRLIYPSPVTEKNCYVQGNVNNIKTR